MKTLLAFLLVAVPLMTTAQQPTMVIKLSTPVAAIHQDVWSPQPNQIYQIFNENDLEYPYNARWRDSTVIALNHLPSEMAGAQVGSAGDYMWWELKPHESPWDGSMDLRNFVFVIKHKTHGFLFVYFSEDGKEMSLQSLTLQ